jgi:hypothetical protein
MPKVLINAQKEQICRYSNDYVQRYPFSKYRNFSRASMHGLFCQNLTFSKRSPAVISTSLPNHLIRLDKHVLWYHEAKLLRSLQIDENLEFFRQLHLQIPGPCALQNLDDVASGTPV